MGRFATAAALCGALLLLPACKSKFFAGQRQSDLITTDLLVSTSPSGAMVYMDGAELDTAPFKMPVEYHHVETIHSRQNNVGASIRKSTGVIGTILLFPIWIPLSLIHGTETVRRHEYGNNKHTVSALLPGHDEAWQDITLEGQETFDVSLVLVPSR